MGLFDSIAKLIKATQEVVSEAKKKVKASDKRLGLTEPSSSYESASDDFRPKSFDDFVSYEEDFVSYEEAESDVEMVEDSMILEPKSDDYLHKFVLNTSFKVATLAKLTLQSLAPSATGELVDSIETAKPKLVLSQEDCCSYKTNVNINAPYAIFVEYGTGIAGKEASEPYPGALPSSWTYDHNEYGEKGWVFPTGEELPNGKDEFIRTRGMRPNPFVYDTRQYVLSKAHELYFEGCNEAKLASKCGGRSATINVEADIIPNTSTGTIVLSILVKARIQRGNTGKRKK